MKKIFAYPLSVIYYLYFGFLLCFFHLLQIVSLNVFGKETHKKVVDILNWFLMGAFGILGIRFKVSKSEKLKEGQSYIFAANHQSTYDIPPMIWHLRKYHAKFISKKSLGKGIPSISYNLRRGGHLLIDRKNPTQAINDIKTFASDLQAQNYSCAIYPEGTRSRSARPKKFHRSGLVALMENMPDAAIVPIAIQHSWKLAQNNYFPFPVGVRILVVIMDPIEQESKDPNVLIDLTEKQIGNRLAVLASS